MIVDIVVNGQRTAGLLSLSTRRRQTIVDIVVNGQRTAGLVSSSSRRQQTIVDIVVNGQHTAGLLLCNPLLARRIPCADQRLS